MGACLQSRSSSIATANGPEAHPGSREEVGNTQASLQRSTLRAQARHCCWVTAHIVGVLRVAKIRSPRMWEGNLAAAQLRRERGT